MCAFPGYPPQQPGAANPFGGAPAADNPFGGAPAPAANPFGAAPPPPGVPGAPGMPGMPGMPGGDAFGAPSGGAFGAPPPPQANGGMANGGMNGGMGGMAPPPPGGAMGGGGMAPPPPGAAFGQPQQGGMAPPPPGGMGGAFGQQAAPPPPPPPGPAAGVPPPPGPGGMPVPGGMGGAYPNQFEQPAGMPPGQQQVDAFGNPIGGPAAPPPGAFPQQQGMMGQPGQMGMQPGQMGGMPGQPGMGGMQPPGPGMMPGGQPGATSVPGMNQQQLYQQLLAKADEFNCGTHFVRPAMNRIPQSSRAKNKIGVPMGAVISPMADAPPGVAPIKVVEPGQGAQNAIVRCRKCRTYMNPYVVWENNGRKWRCNMCEFVNETAQSYYSPVDQNTGLRTDVYQRPELCNGACEFIATGDYMVRAPMPPVYLFLIETSMAAVQTGFLESTCQAIKHSILSGEMSGSDRTLVSIMTFDSSLHFYNMDSSLSSAQMVVVSDLEDIFLPLPDDMLINLSENEEKIMDLLDTIPSLFAETRIQESCFGTALTGSYMAMKHVGGKVLAFIASIPNCGMGALNAGRNNPGLQQKNEEIEMLKPINKDYAEFASKLIYMQMSCDLFVAPLPGQYIDLATVKMIAQDTGGEVKFYDNFRPQTMGKKLREEVKHVLTRFTGWESVMRVRVSKGWRITHFFGHLFVRGQDLLTMPNCNRDYNFAITIEMEEGVSVVDNQCFIQAALLYTNHEAERRIRVLTHSIVASNNQQELVQSVDPIAASSLLAHMTIDRATRINIPDSRNWLNSQTQLIMANSAHIAEQGNFCFLPLYVFGILRCPALRIGPGPDLRFDARAANWTRIATISCERHANYFVPRLLAIHNLSAEHGQQDPSTGSIKLPEKLPLAGQELANNGAYLIENGEYIICYVGQECDPALVQAWFGVPSANELPVDGTVNEEDLLAPNGTPQKDQLINIVEEIRLESNSVYMNFSLTVQGRRDYLESRFWEGLIEDKSATMNISYGEFAARMKQAGGGIRY